MEANGGVANPYYTGRAAHAAADPSSLINHFNGLTLGSLSMPNNGAPVPMGPGHAFMVNSDSQFVLTPVPTAQPMGLGHSNENPYLNYPGAAGGYGASYVGLSMPLVPFTPGRPGTAQPRADRGHSDVPGLENRRGSYSTTESAPATPYYGGAFSIVRDYPPRVASLDRSSYTTPSPNATGLAPVETAKPIPMIISDRTIDELLKKDPAIPKAVPAVFTPPGQMKTLEQSLENRIPGNRNVYIRGLHPTTDDELLYHFTSRFGAVETSKAIIDTNTGACKGFGFAKFYDVRDSELCIRAFHRLGYEIGFARESFNSRLKAEGDEGSTNLYISNLPKSLNEMELATIFLGYHIQSSKILRDSMGNSRGVGFARFDSREICDEIVRKFNGIGIGEEGLPMNIRYADTPAQKELKRVTAERRQFRTNEYNIGAYGTPLVGLNPALYNQQAHWRRNLPQSRRREAQCLLVHSLRTHTTEAFSLNSNSFGRATTSADATISTPTTSECDESVTIRADPAVVASAGKENIQPSPSVKKEASKKDSQ
ncbi:uncharacterized protein TRIVIDRAFT_149145 [Trichoderma virens Gv29-8]|uniref:RRM domain-containing protein n=1 Tax=Hypocrea virens (strain Gv29-8 / FGSC 10586) TaxID=413071 RepID=G9MSM7_HYPVG|nr:uncharacterized protein TRIVIDRAFT_149145 [Trichoderma virens Gv29-8]EHK22189.1 hypothetical protein TRIVIDRAFT_149145 [Trichoderma virens Gv29-8]UKZ47225.1 hypothetical protein TrVGV298_001441 [Trichoderma virens]